MDFCLCWTQLINPLQAECLQGTACDVPLAYAPETSVLRGQSTSLSQQRMNPGQYGDTTHVRQEIIRPSAVEHLNGTSNNFPSYSDTNLPDSSPMTYHDTHREEHQVISHNPQYHVPHRLFDCKWYDGCGLCGLTADAERIAEHMRTYHFESRGRAGNVLYCQWEGCQRSEPLRRDTIVRHIREVHLRIPRSKPLARARLWIT